MRFMRFRKAGILSLVVGLAVVLSGCGSGKATEQAPSNGDAFTTAWEYAQEDTNAGWDAGNATAVAFGDGEAQISGNGATFRDGILTIKRAGTYVLSGTVLDGQVLIDAGKDDVVRLVLNGVSIHHEKGPAIYASKSEKVVLILAEGTENTITDGSGYLAEGGDEPDAAIFVQDDLSITGTGELNVIGAMKHGIRTQDVLAITGGTIHVDAVGDALRGRDGVAVEGGVLSLKAGGDGIQSNNAEDDAKGFVIISGGAFLIEAGSDGIQAQTALTVTGGSFQIKTGGGSANAPTREEEFPGGGRGGWGGGWAGGQNAWPEATAEESASMKAVKAGKRLTITGGEFTIDAEDDAVHSNDALLIAGGRFLIQTGDDGFHADAALGLSGGEIDIPICYEGIEGLSVTISGGDISIAASDDAVNAAGGTDNASPMGGPMGGDRFAVNGDIFVRISGGTLDLYAPHDGIDANGNIFFEGGIVKISGPSQGMEGAIDLDGALVVTGGELITAGSVLNASADSTQPVVLVSYAGQIASGSLIEVKDAQGKTLLEYESKTACSLSGFTSPAFAIGETYSLFINGERRVGITLDNVITSIGDDGGAYNGGRGGGRGNWNWGGGMLPEGEMPPGGGSAPEATPPEGSFRPGGGS